MAEVFETLTGAGDPFSSSGSGRLVQAKASDLSQVASRASQRQQALVDRDLSPSDSEVFSPRPKSKNDKTGLGTPSGQMQGVPGVTNSVSNAAAAGTDLSGILDEDLAPTHQPFRLGTEPQDVEYGDLSPAQRGAALRSTGMEAVDYAVDPETKKMRRAKTGAAVLAFKAPLGGEQLFLAEDGAPAHAALMKAVNDGNLRAMPTNGSDDYGVSWNVHPEDRARFMRVVEYFEPGSLEEGADGRVQVGFTEQNSLNRTFMRAPFGSKKNR
jgi:hypothetical protein